MPRTILLIQPGERVEKRTYSRFQSIDDCMERVCKTYEGVLKRENPKMRIITYDITELFQFIDMLKDITCLVHQRDTNEYVPRNRDWIKDQIHAKLHRTSITSKVLKKKLAENVHKE
ncbi:enhancer of rudimentary homolog [Drosophila obscura]|uniref:enhancer of rudimentary homolog n=1 Tax=Drosophila obscura TaxID=7282 RepID=UPI000BA0E8A9|nr:enhancer of rudimentary homolog [Drosophila obscura]